MREFNLFSAPLELLDNELDTITHRVIQIVDTLKSRFREIESRNKSLAHYLYALKIIHDLNLSKTNSMSKPSDLQIRVFGTSFNINTDYSHHESDLKEWIDEVHNPYLISLRQIEFSETAKERIIEFIRSQLKVFIKQGAFTSPSLIVRSFHTIWREISGDFGDLFPADPRFKIRRSESAKFVPTSEFISSIGIVRAYVLNNEGHHYDIPCSQNTLKFDNVPAGEYNLVVKTDYEPSNDSVANFIDKISIE